MNKAINTPMWDKMQFFCKEITDHQIRFLLHFDTTLDEFVLKKAISIAVENNPIIGAKYVEKQKQALWQLSEIDIDKIFVFSKCQPQELEKLQQKEILNSIDTFATPQLSISLLRAETDTLIINCNHTISDAAGVMNFTYQIAHNYSQISKGNIISKQNNPPFRSLKVLSSKLGINQKIAALGLLGTNQKPAPTFSKNIKTTSLQNPGFKTHTINSINFEKLKAFGKKHSATVNDLFLAIYYLTLKSILRNSNKTNRLSYTSDLRVFMEDKKYDILSNYSAIHTIDINNTIHNFVELLNSISSQTKIRKQLKYNIADFPMMALLFKILPYRKVKGIFQKAFTKIKEGKTDSAPSLTNMGVIKDNLLIFDTVRPVRANILGGINHPNLFQIGISTYKNELTLSIGSYYSGKNEIFISKFLEEFIKLIENEILKPSC